MIRALPLLLLLSGCTHGQAFVRGPMLDVVCVAPVWSTKHVIAWRCGEGNTACAEVGQYNGQLRYMWVERPEFFDDGKTLALGHELLHALGATHGER